MKIHTKAKNLSKILKDAGFIKNLEKEKASLEVDKKNNINGENKKGENVAKEVKINLENIKSPNQKQPTLDKKFQGKTSSFNSFFQKKELPNPKKIGITNQTYFGKNPFKKNHNNQNISNKNTKNINKPKTFEWFLILPLFFLLLSGLAYLASALNTQGSKAFTSNFTEQTVFVFLGCLFCFILSKIDYHKILQRYKMFFYPSLFLLLILSALSFSALIASLFTHHSFSDLQKTFAQNSHIAIYSQGAMRWLNFLGKISIQPAELIKITLLFYLAHILPKTLETKSWKNPILIIILILFSVMLQPDLGTTVILFLIILSALWITKIPLKYFLSLILLALLLGSYMIFGVSFRSKRVQTWAYQNFCSQYDLNDLKRNIPKKSERKGICGVFDFNINLADDNYQTERIRSALASGSWFGTGYNNGKNKSLIPERTNDGIIGVIGEEGGFSMVFLILISYLLIFLRGINIAQNAPDLEGKILATGVSVWILIQAFWNITGMTGLVPMKGLPLPFISEGGTAMISNLLGVGILWSVANYQQKTGKNWGQK